MIQRLVLVAALTALTACGATVSRVEWVGTHVWTEDAPGFGGLSGIEISEDGSRFTIVNDSARLYTGRIARDGAAITGVQIDSTTRLRAPDGTRLRGKDRDAEGLALGPDGQLFVSFEGPARVHAYATPDATPAALPQHPEFAGMMLNSALESLAIDAQGRLYAIPERSGRIDRPFPVYRYDGTGWREAFALPRRDAFLAVGLDIGPDGRLYLLERDFTGIGFRTRLRRFGPDGGGEEVLLQTRTGTYDNLEGISVWRDAGGALRVTLVSDDNFRFYQQTQIVEFRLTD